MRFPFLMATTVLVSVVAVHPAFAGLDRHDKSIASYGYNIVIDTSEAGTAGGDLKGDLDGGTAATGVIKQQPADAAPAVMPAPSPVESAPVVPYTPGDVKPLQAPTGAKEIAPQSSSDVQTQNAVAPLAVGSAAPNITLPNAAGEFVALSDTLAKGPTLVLFIRGTSSPYDIQQLQLLQKNLGKLNQLGIQALAVSPEPLDNLARAQAKYKLGYNVLSDNQNIFAEQYGVLQVAAPTPSLFSVSADGKIAAIQIQPKMSAIFDLAEATLPFRETSQTAVAATTAQAATAQDAAKIAPAAGVEAPVATQAAPIAKAPDATNVMPAVPSPQADKAQNDKLFVPKISMKLPPSHPDFKKLMEAKALAI